MSWVSTLVTVRINLKIKVYLSAKYAPSSLLAAEEEREQWEPPPWACT
jgi:hypothetical protein